MHQRQNISAVTKLRNYSSSAAGPSLPPPVVVENEWVQFAPALAHEIRNPLSNINLAVDMLQAIIAEEEVKLYLDIILRASTRVNELINDLLLHHQHTKAQPEICCVKELLNEVPFMNADRLMLKNIRVTKSYAPDNCSILADKQKIRIALTNIIINAIEAMEAENGQLKLSVKLINAKCIIEIEDNGTGMSMNNLQQIFKPYFSRKESGMGLGLSTTIETLSANRVKVAVQSEEGIGTRFILSFKSEDQRKPLENPVFMIR